MNIYYKKFSVLCKNYKEVDVEKSGKNIKKKLLFEYFDHQMLESCGFFVCKLNNMFEQLEILGNWLEVSLGYEFHYRKL